MPMVIDNKVALEEISKIVADQMGLYFPEDRWVDLQRGLNAAAREFGYGETDACVRWLLSERLTRRQIELLASHLTVGETYFFRENNLFEILRERILTELVQQRPKTQKMFRMWCAGCATGEEPYSIAILLRELLPDIENWQINILATDINLTALQKAMQGIYGNWSFRESPAWVKPKYFQRVAKNSYKLIPEVRKLVNFGYLNLAQDPYPSLLNGTNGLDIIFCRNVLMYFNSITAQKVISNHYQCLVENGWYIVSPSELSLLQYSSFSTVRISDTFLHRKSNRPVKIHIPAQVNKPDAIQEIAPKIVREPVSRPLEIKPEIQPLPGSYEKAIDFYRQGYYRQAEDEITAWLTRSRHDISGMALLARIQANRGDLDSAKELCHQCISAEKLNPTYYYLLATIEQEQGQSQEAIKSLNRAIYLDRDFILANFMLGNLYRHHGKITESHKCFQNTISLLSHCRSGDTIPEGDGLTAGRLAEIIDSIMSMEKPA